MYSNTYFIGIVIKTSGALLQSIDERWPKKNVTGLFFVSVPLQRLYVLSSLL